VTVITSFVEMNCAVLTNVYKGKILIGFSVEILSEEKNIRFSLSLQNHQTNEHPTNKIIPPPAHRH